MGILSRRVVPYRQLARWCSMREAPFEATGTKGSRGWTNGPLPFVYMSATVGIAELRQNLSKYLRRVEHGERLVVTDRNRPVAELGPPATRGADLDRLIAEGRISRPIRRGLPGPLRLEGDPHALSRALDEIRADR
jgi:prevent-host-death family protein